MHKDGVLHNKWSVSIHVFEFLSYQYYRVEFIFHDLRLETLLSYRVEQDIVAET